MHKQFRDAINTEISNILTDITKSRDTDIRAALTDWKIPGFPENAEILEYPNQDTLDLTDPKHPTAILSETIVLTDTRDHSDQPTDQDTPIKNRFQRIYQGTKYKVALLAPEESAKIPSNRSRTV